MEPARRRWWSRSATQQRKGDYHLLGWQTLAIDCSSQPKTSFDTGVQGYLRISHGKKGATTAPDKIRKSSPTLLLAGRMRSFRDYMTVDTHQRARAHNKGVPEACRDIKAINEVSFLQAVLKHIILHIYRDTHYTHDRHLTIPFADRPITITGIKEDHTSSFLAFPIASDGQ